MSKTDPTEPRDSELLLPWHVIQRLDAEAAARLDTELAEDPELARRFELARQERVETVAVNRALGTPSAAARAALFARIDAEVARTHPTRTRLDRLAGWLSALSPRAMAISAAIAALVIVIQAGLLSMVVIGGGEGSRYVTAASPEAPKTAGQLLLVAFVPGASAAQVTALLRETHAAIVDGPHPGGIYEVKVADAPLSPADLKAAIELLRKQTSVVQFVASESGSPAR